MKINVFLLIVAFIAVAACGSSDERGVSETNKLATDTANFTSIKWIDSLQNIGVVEPGKKKKITFGFLNTGTKPLYIISAKPGCGCTVADYPKEAIAPGEKGEITAGYAVPEHEGEFRKNIMVTTNTKSTKVHNIFFYGQIKKEGDSTNAKSTAVK